MRAAQLPRAISDLSLVRRWISFGIVLLVVNTLTILIGFVFLLSISWILGVVFVVCSIPLWIYGYLFEQKYSVVARRSQDQARDLEPPSRSRYTVSGSSRRPSVEARHALRHRSRGGGSAALAPR
jgi:ABC-type multidrug transport system fused ATPase/permease subunit